jgi:hypothetical protein
MPQDRKALSYKKLKILNKIRNKDTILIKIKHQCLKLMLRYIIKKFDVTLLPSSKMKVSSRTAG